MKRIVLVFLMSIMSLPLLSQRSRDFQLNTRQIDIEQQRTAFGITAEEFNNIVGSPYANEKFVAGNIYKDEKTLFKDVQLRYNIFSDEIEISKDANKPEESYSALIKEPNTLVKIFDDIYIFVPFEGSFEKGHYFSIITEETHFDLYKKSEVTYKQPVYAKTNYDRDRPGTFTQKHTYYLVTKDGKFYELPNSKSKIIKVMSQKGSEVKAFIKKNRLDLKSEKDLAKLVKYYNSLL